MNFIEGRKVQSGPQKSSLWRTELYRTGDATFRTADFAEGDLTVFLDTGNIERVTFAAVRAASYVTRDTEMTLMDGDVVGDDEGHYKSCGDKISSNHDER